jgi:uncharacterized protein YcbK (DUF882 family)
MIDRRKLLRTGTGAGLLAAGMGLPFQVFGEDIEELRLARAQIAEPDLRKLALYNLHTDESTDVVYKERGQIIPGALQEVNRILRDFRTGDITDIDVSLLDLLDDLKNKLEVNVPFNVISGYRSPQTNAALAARSDGVARGSLHMQGKAIDIRVPGVALTHLRNVAKEMNKGGVGFYARSDFVHVDTGRVRYW